MNKKRKILHAIILTIEIFCSSVSLLGLLYLGAAVGWDWIYLLTN